MKRGRLILLVFLACAVIAAGALTHKRWPQLLRRAPDQTSGNPRSEELLSSVPPFSTREPERYQATRIIRSVEQNGTKKNAPETAVTKTLIARDGQKRREEYEIDSSGPLVYLETEAGHFVLLPAKKLYADLDLNLSGPEGTDSGSERYADLSPERLLDETRAVARYEKLGSDTIAGRSTTKYRVTSGEPANASAGADVTLIWIDDALGMPIRSETTSTGEDRISKLTIELSDIRQQVDPRIFELPKDYRKVGLAQLDAERAQARRMQGAGEAEVRKP
jgi:hypothetical protein